CHGRSSMFRRMLGRGHQALRALLGAVDKERDDLRRENNELRKLQGRFGATPSFEGDGLATWSKNLSFLTDPRFISAYTLGENSGHASWTADGKPMFDIRYRVAVTLWAATHGSKLPGDFVECGVNTGFHSLAICQYIDFNSLDKNFWLFDT